MGLSVEQVGGDDQGRVQSSAAELSEPPSLRRQQPPTENLKCPRCDSMNTKFCYYNNYNKSQPRHFCKSCKRHWTKGGTLRSVPVGGGRKNKRPKLSNPTTTTTSSATATTVPPTAAAHRQNIDKNISSDNQSNISNSIYQTLIRSSSPLLNNNNNNNNNTTDSIGLSILEKPFNMGSNSTAANGSSAIPNADQLFPFSCFEVNASSLNIPTSFDPHHRFNSYDQYHMENNSGEESSTVTTVNVPNGTSSPLPWAGPDMDLISDYNWGWNEIDLFASSDLNITWNDEVDRFKFKP